VFVCGREVIGDLGSAFRGTTAAPSNQTTHPNPGYRPSRGAPPPHTLKNKTARPDVNSADLH